VIFALCTINTTHTAGSVLFFGSESAGVGIRSGFTTIFLLIVIVGGGRSGCPTCLNATVALTAYGRKLPGAKKNVTDWSARMIAATYGYMTIGPVSRLPALRFWAIGCDFFFFFSPSCCL